MSEQPPEDLTDDAIMTWVQRFQHRVVVNVETDWADHAHTIAMVQEIARRSNRSIDDIWRWLDLTSYPIGPIAHIEQLHEARRAALADQQAEAEG